MAQNSSIFQFRSYCYFLHSIKEILDKSGKICYSRYISYKGGMRLEQLKEIWKDIKGYEGCYQVSNLGGVRSLDRYINGNKNSKWIRKGVVLKPHKNRNGYLIVRLQLDGHNLGKTVGRLVAETFTPNPNNYPEVNHKDENKSNNHVDNLEWCSYSYNTNYGTRNDRVSKILTNHPLKSKIVYQYSLNGEFIKEYQSTRECERQGFHQSGISRCCLCEQKTHKGYIWKYKEDVVNE